MPTYDYVCDACSHSFELFQSIKDNAKRKCPECGRQKLRRLFGTGAAIVFKGSGFYQTDYRSESYRKAAEADKKASAPATEGSKSGESKSGGESKSSGESKSGGESGKAAQPASSTKSESKPASKES